MARIGSTGKRWGGPWYGQFHERRKFEQGAALYRDLVSRYERRPGRLGYAYHLTIDIWGELRRVEIRFSKDAARVPHVYVDGPTDSPHRFEDGSLCMWHPRDPADRRWTFNDGLVMLIGYITAHLFREAWWRETGEWPGEEATHDKTA